MFSRGIKGIDQRPDFTIVWLLPGPVPKGTYLSTLSVGLKSSGSNNLHHLAGNNFTVYSTGAAKQCESTLPGSLWCRLISGLLSSAPAHGAQGGDSLGQLQ